METNNKYYTPTIEEFHVGFEYESRFIENSMWGKCVLDEDFATPIIIEEIELENCRVKYLDQEDIESLGFFCDNIDNSFFETKDETRWINIEYFEKGRGWYLSFDEEESQFTFSGYVKNKSELKRLLKKF